MKVFQSVEAIKIVNQLMTADPDERVMVKVRLDRMVASDCRGSKIRKVV